MSEFFVEQGRKLQDIRDRLGVLTSHWIPICGLDSWGLSFDYQITEDPETPKAIGIARVDSKYKTASIIFNLAKMLNNDQTLEQTEYVVVHELAHVLVHEMRGAMNWDDNDMWHEERVVTEIACALLRANGKTPNL